MEYDVALSFVGEDREQVEAVAQRLKGIDIRIFYDNLDNINLWKKDLYTHLQNVYQNQATITVIFISRHYAKKIWIGEKDIMAQARAFTEASDYIALARLDNTEIEGIKQQVRYFNIFESDDIIYQIAVMLDTLKPRKVNENSIESNEELIAVGLFEDKVKLVSLTSDGNYNFLDESHNLHRILFTFSSETVAFQQAIDELESLMNDSKSKEKDFQNFFERNPDFILNDDYKKAHPHIILTKDDGKNLIPDFVLEPIEQNSLCDLLELKLPSTPIYVLKKNRKHFSSAVLEACAQIREYAMFFDENRNRELIQQKYGLMAFKPKMIVVIGRRGNVSPIEVRKMESDLPNLQLRTYDDILTRVKDRHNAMKTGKLRK